MILTFSVPLISYPGDTRNSDSVQEFVKAVIEEYGQIDVLMNNGMF